ncbi:MAG: hypothetical protein ACO3GX_08675, partial [Gemmataceae bacterium]
MGAKNYLGKFFRFFKPAFLPNNIHLRKLYLERLENREVMNRATWISTADGDWNTAANWDIRDANNNTVSGVPTIADDVIIDLASNNPVISISTAAVAKTILSTEKISISGNGASLQIANASTIAGNIEIKNGGTLQTDSQLTLSGTVDWISGTLTDTGSSSITITGTTNLTGNGTILNTTLTNHGTFNITGSAALALTTAILANDNPGTVDIQNDVSITATGSTLENKGLLKKSAGANTT